jgi:hypothetical protein
VTEQECPHGNISNVDDALMRPSLTRCPHDHSHERTNPMPKLTVFNTISLDGYFTDDTGDLSWAHKQDAEWNAFMSGNPQ